MTGNTQEPDVRVEPDALRRFAAAVMAAAGLTDADAAMVADSLLSAEMRGHASHGVARLPIYVRRLEASLVNPRPQMRFVVDDGAVAVLDADNGSGAPAAAAAMRKAIAMARGHGVGTCAVRNSNHCGALAYYTEMAAAQGMIGLAATNANITMAPWGGREAALGTNPISAAVPTPGNVPFVLDMATSAVARGKIILAAAKGQHIPEGWALDPSGRSTHDASAALRGVMLPAGGYKGSGLAAVVDILCGALAGGAVGRQIGSLYSEFDRPQRSGHFMMALEVARFVPLPVFLGLVEALIAGIKSVAPAEGFDEVLIPGEPEARAEARARREGIMLPSQVRTDLTDLARRLRVAEELDPWGGDVHR